MNVNARERHVYKIEVVKEDLQASIKGTPHYNDVYKHYRKLCDELELYDRLQKGQQ